MIYRSDEIGLKGTILTLKKSIFGNGSIIIIIYGEKRSIELMSLDQINSE